MRLIDADALELEPDENNAMNGVLFVVRRQGGGRTIAMVQSALKKMIENAPTIDAAPVVYGYWEYPAGISHETTATCSVCRRRIKLGTYNFYCPACGSRNKERKDG